MLSETKALKTTGKASSSVLIMFVLVSCDTEQPKAENASADQPGPRVHVIRDQLAASASETVSSPSIKPTSSEAKSPPVPAPNTVQGEAKADSPRSPVETGVIVQPNVVASITSVKSKEFPLPPTSVREAVPLKDSDNALASEQQKYPAVLSPAGGEAKTELVAVEVKQPVSAAPAPALPAPKFNDLVLDAIQKMPKGGGYAVTSAANTALRKAVRLKGDKFNFEHKDAVPSYCSGATYQVFVHALQTAWDKQKIKAPVEARQALLVAGQPDGTGVWGRWNANGPGTARLFFETGIGVNFEDWRFAAPGDFLKIFWNEHIGKREFGHSVVFLGLAPNDSGGWELRFWSSNQPDGYGEKSVPITKIKRVIFSRLTEPSAVTKLATLGTDAYLKDMLKRDGTAAELLKMTGQRGW